MIYNNKDLGKEKINAYYVIRKHSRDTYIEIVGKDNIKISFYLSDKFDLNNIKINDKFSLIDYIFFDNTLVTKNNRYTFNIEKEVVNLTKLEDNLYNIEVKIDKPDMVYSSPNENKSFDNLYINANFKFIFEDDKYKKTSPMVRILTSSFNNYHEENGKKIPNTIDNSNKIVDHIKKYLNKCDTLLYIVSDPNEKEKTKLYSDILFESLKLSGISFKEYIILNNDNINKAKEYIKKADLIFLSGGDTYIENEFFNSFNLSELLKDYNGLVIGQSAGALNMAKYVFNSPENMDDSEPIYFKGLGLTNINIEPHFVYDDTNFTEEEKFQRDAILLESYNRKIYGECDNSHIIIDKDDNIFIYGETYLITNGKILPYIKR